MSDYSYHYPAPLWHNTNIRPEFHAGRIGMMVGGMAAFAENLHAFRSGEKSQQQAVSDALRTTVYAGASASVADLVHRQIGRNGWMSTLAAITAGSAMMYFLVRNDSRIKEKSEAEAETETQANAAQG